MTDSDFAPFLGLWLLDPSRYSDPADPPKRGVYTILGDAEGLDFHARWTDAADETQQLAFRVFPDGQPRDLPEAPGMTMTTVLEDGALVSRIARSGADLHRIVWTLDGEDLRVRQEVRGESGWQSTEAAYTRTGAKQVLLYRRDLKMRKGKIAAQCAHASMAVFFRRNQGPPAELQIPLDGPMAVWCSGRFTKVVLSVEGEEELLRAHRAALAAGLPASLITDAGRTEFHGVPTKTAAAIGPAAVEEIDLITGKDGLVPTRLA